ncbi:unnamed protein product, partial [Prorocentrum cordatum]
EWHCNKCKHERGSQVGMPVVSWASNTACFKCKRSKGGQSDNEKRMAKKTQELERQLKAEKSARADATRGGDSMEVEESNGDDGKDIGIQIAMLGSQIAQLSKPEIADISKELREGLTKQRAELVAQQRAPKPIGAQVLRLSRECDNVGKAVAKMESVLEAENKQLEELQASILERQGRLQEKRREHVELQAQLDEVQRRVALAPAPKREAEFPSGQHAALGLGLSVDELEAFIKQHGGGEELSASVARALQAKQREVAEAQRAASRAAPPAAQQQPAPQPAQPPLGLEGAAAAAARAGAGAGAAAAAEATGPPAEPSIEDLRAVLHQAGARAPVEDEQARAHADALRQALSAIGPGASGRRVARAAPGTVMY